MHQESEVGKDPSENQMVKITVKFAWSRGPDGITRQDSMLKYKPN